MQEDSRTDLVSLHTIGGAYPSEEAISVFLANRYKRNLPYTQLGYSNFIVVNPYQPLELLNDATLRSYAEVGYKDLSEQKLPLQPHIYELATRVYFHMRRTGEDQSIILSGITGSGKSTTRTHFLCELLQLSAHNKRENKLSSQIQNSLVILEAFGNCRTVQNTSASKFGLFQEVQFNERGRILGTKTLAYQFDKSRVTNVPQSERTYHVFYSLLAGTNTEEKNALHINFKPEYFNYLGQSGCITTPNWNDEIEFGDLKSALKLCGFKAKSVTYMFQLLSAILHLGNLQFAEGTDSLAQEACVVKNTDVLDIVAVMLGVSPNKLESCLTYKLKVIGKEVCTLFLNPTAANEQRDSLARSLYNALFLWIVESINRKVCFNDADEPANVVGIMDQFGFQNFASNGFEEFCINLANERMHHFLVNENFNNSHGINETMLRDGIPVPSVKVVDNSACLELLLGRDQKALAEDSASEKKEKVNKSASLALGGLAGLMDRDTARLQTGTTDATNANFLGAVQRQFSNHPSMPRGSQTYAFGINHFSGTVNYTVDMFLEKNLDELSPDFVNLLRDSSNSFLSNLFESAAMATESHPKDARTIVKAQLSSKPARAPSMRRKPTRRRLNIDKTLLNTLVPEDEATTNEDIEMSKKIKEAEEAYENMQHMTVVDQLYITLRDITFSMSDTKIYNVIHIRPNDTQQPDFDHNRVKSQIRAFLIPGLIVRHHFEYANYYSHPEFLERYNMFVASVDIHADSDANGKEIIDHICAVMKWNIQSVYVGKEFVWLSFPLWKMLEDGLRVVEKESREQAKQETMPPLMGGAVAGMGEQVMPDTSSSDQGQKLLSDHYDHGEGGFNEQYTHEDGYDDNVSYGYSEDKREVDGSQWGEEFEWGIKNGLSEGFGPNMDMSKMMEDVNEPKIENIEEVPITKVRRWWVRFVWLLTFWIPSPFLRWCGKMKRSDIQMAWREKVALCMVIAFFSGIILFLICGLGVVVCPGTGTMYSTSYVADHGTQNDNYMSVRGYVYDMTQFSKAGHGSTATDATEDAMTALAGTDVSSSIPPPLTVACAGLITDNSVQIVANTTEFAQASFIHYSGPQLRDPSLNATMGQSLWYWNTFLPAITQYKKGTLVHSIQQLADDANGWNRNALAMYGKVYDLQDYFSTITIYGSVATQYSFLNSVVTDIFKNYRGTDATAQWEANKDKMTVQEQEMNMNCLDSYFMIGFVDPRETPRCTFANYLLLSFAVLMCAVILVKFLAALQFGSTPTPEEHDKFVICQVPCYTEDEDSLKKTIDSLTVMDYDDKRKLLFIIADGMLMGSGNDRPTPRIVLDILGYDTKNDPEPLMFKSVGEGAKQLNYGKVYSGLYECEGHVVPYLVIAKVGKASERAKPGNRGKRDSQMICMNFLNRVHFDSAMTPMELEIYHQIKNVIGVNPSFYEYILMVDSDTEVMAHSLKFMISCMLHDGRIVGLCGETKIANESKSWTTMIQVYEYYISHYLAKAFESLFGSVTCLPGCFCMYRIRTPVKNEPLIISPDVIRDYSDNHVDTLHKKNLLSLGEDRYLTTLMMKHFPQYKMKFTPHALCQTVAPDKWQVLLSQRRRWINSTVHNLMEVILLPDLCGFCFFSMRFVVLLDLIGTLTLPVSFGYLVYLVYVIAAHSGPFPILALGMLAGLYALQILIFVLKRQWQHIGWMFFYLLALPVYTFALPIYSFWHFDDFSWGNTRVVVGDNQRKIIVTDDEKFDEKMIPMKKWSIYEQELWEMGSHRSGETGYTGKTGNSYNSYGMGSVHGPLPVNDNRSQYSGGDYDYYRDTKKNEKPFKQQPFGYDGQTGSVVGSDYGGRNTGIPMSEYGGHNTGIPMSEYGGRNTGIPMSEYGGHNNGVPMSEYRGSMVAPPSHMSTMRPMSHMSGSVAPYYNNMVAPSHMSIASFGPMGGFGDRPRIASYNHGSNLSSQHLLHQNEFDIPMDNVSQSSVPSMMPGVGFPTDGEIQDEIQLILDTADLMKVTKKQIREQLSKKFGVDMNIKKGFINASIEQQLSQKNLQ